MLTRDSWVLILVVLGSVFGYFATLPPPWDWAWSQWMNFGIFITGLLAAKLSESKLAASTTPLRDAQTALGGLLKVYDRKE